MKKNKLKAVQSSSLSQYKSVCYLFLTHGSTDIIIIVELFTFINLGVELVLQN